MPCSVTRSCSQQWRVLPTRPDDKEIARERLLIKDPLRDNPLVSRHTRRDKATSSYFFKHTESSFLECYDILHSLTAPPYAKKSTSQMRIQGAVCPQITIFFSASIRAPLLLLEAFSSRQWRDWCEGRLLTCRTGNYN